MNRAELWASNYYKFFGSSLNSDGSRSYHPNHTPWEELSKEVKNAWEDVAAAGLIRPVED